MVTQVSAPLLDLPYTSSQVLAAIALSESIRDGSAVSTGATLAAGAVATRTVTVSGAAMGDFALASFSVTTGSLLISASVTAANTVTVVITNPTAGNIDIAVGTVYARVIKRT